MEKNLKKVIAIVLVVIALISCTACGTSETPKTFNVGYSKAEQSIESRMSRIIDDYVIDYYGIRTQYKVENFKEYWIDNNFQYEYTFTIILDIQDRLENVKTLEINCRIDYEGKNLRDYDIKQID